MSESLTPDQLREALALWEKQPFQPASYQSLIAAARFALTVLEGEIPERVVKRASEAIMDEGDFDHHEVVDWERAEAYARAAIEAALAEWAKEES